MKPEYRDKIDMILSQNKGLLIAFEGGDGVGKTTLANALESDLTSQRIKTLYVRNPGSDEVTNKIREITKKYNLEWFSYACLFGAALKHSIETQIKPMLEENYVVLIDRFVRSTYVYQMFYHKFENESDEDYNKRLNLFRMLTEGCVKDVVTEHPFREFLIDMNEDYKTAWERIHGRETDETVDIWESQGYDYFKAIHEAYYASFIDTRKFYGMDAKYILGTLSTDEMLEVLYDTL